MHSRAIGCNLDVGCSLAVMAPNYADNIISSIDSSGALLILMFKLNDQMSEFIIYRRR